MTTNLLDQITNAIEGEWNVRQAEGVQVMAFYHRHPQGLYAGWTDAQVDRLPSGSVKVTFYVSGMSAGTFNVHTLEEATDLFDKRYAR